METTELVDYYAILGVPRTADADAIKNAVRAERRVWVKRQQAPKLERRQEAELRVRQLADAEKTLLDPASRRAYDAKLDAYVAPTPTAGPGPVGGADWVSRAEEYLRAGNPLAAHAAAREATSADGSNHRAWYVRAHASMMLNSYGDAVFEFGEAIRLSPNDPEYHFDLGTLHEANEQWAAAQGEYQVASRLDPQNPLYQVAIANTLIQMDRPDDALPILEPIHARHPDVEDFNFYLALALYYSSLQHVSSVRGIEAFTNEADVKAMRSKLERADALRFDHAELRGELRRILDEVRKMDRLVVRVPFYTSIKGASMRVRGPILSSIVAFFASLFVCSIVIFVPLALWPVNPVSALAFTVAAAAFLIRFSVAPAWKRERHLIRVAATPF
jgi:tetratricopeptide (TPR) repeat protein